MKLVRWAFVTAVVVSLGACNSSSSSCTPGESLTCGCADGQQGAQACQQDGTYAACVCNGGSTSNSGSAGSSTGGLRTTSSGGNGAGTSGASAGTGTGSSGGHGTSTGESAGSSSSGGSPSSGASTGGGSGASCPDAGPLTVTSQYTPDTTVGALYAYGYQAVGGCPPYTWTIIAGSLPPGLDMDSAGTITGAATATGLYQFTVQCCDSAGTCVSNDRGINVTAPDGGPSGGSSTSGSAGSGGSSTSGGGGSGGSSSGGGSSSALLTGCVVTGTTASVTGCATSWPPQGWNLVVADGAEEGVPSGVVLDAFGTAICPTGSDNSLGYPYLAHTGTHASCKEYAGDGDIMDIYDALPNGFHGVYLSAWFNTDPDALYANSDYNYEGTTGSGTNGCGVTEQAQAGNLSPASSVNGEYWPQHAMIWSPTDNACEEYFWYDGPLWSPPPAIPAGTWTQVETLIIPNTTEANELTPGNTPPYPCSSPSQAGCGNGTFRVWQDGTLVMDCENCDIAGDGAGLSNFTTGASAFFGGVVTSFATDGVRCTTWGTDGTATTPSTNASPSDCNGTQPGTGSPMPYYRYIDDIIVLYQ